MAYVWNINFAIFLQWLFDPYQLVCRYHIFEFNFPTKEYHSFSRNCNNYIEVSFVFPIAEGNSRPILQARRIKVANYSFICPSRGMHAKSITKYPLIYFLLSSLSLVAWNTDKKSHKASSWLHSMKLGTNLQSTQMLTYKWVV